MGSIIRCEEECPFAVQYLATAGLIEFSYPICNQVGVWTRFHRRSFVVESIRDLEAEPLTLAEINRRPSLRRSRFLLIGQDVELHEPRKFYVGSIRRIRKLDARLTRFAFVDPVTEEIRQWIGTIYTDRKTDQEIARTVFRQMQNRIKQVQRFPYVVALLPWNG